MKKNPSVFLWIARIIALLYLGFITLFAFDEPVISLGFLMHLIPSAVLLLLAILSWNNAKLGWKLYLFVCILFTVYFQTYRSPSTALFISGPLLLTSICFFFSNKSQ